MAEVTERIANFSPEKVRLLARRFSKSDAAAINIPRCGRETNTFPLSFGQERLWFLDQLNPGNPAYNLPFAFRFRFPFDPNGHGRIIDSNLLQNLHRSTINELVRRHEILRTSFPVSDGLPIQVVEPAAPVPLKFIELAGLSEAEREATAKRIIREDTLKPFDLAHGPLCRFGLIQFAPNDHVGFCTYHHIVVDGWSQKTLIKEFQSLLFSALTGNASLLAELPIQYADYAVWQRKWIQGEVWDRLRQYWTQQLKGLPDLQLPTDRPRPAVQSPAGATEPLFLPTPFCNSLRQMGQNQGVTLSMTLLAAWLTLLMRYTGETDVAVCTPVANRTHVETEGLIGFFVNTLVVRVDLSGDPAFSELLKRVWEVCTNAYAHQEMPFEKLVQELQVSRDLGRNPLSRIAFQLVDIPAAGGAATLGSSGSDVTVTPVEVDSETSLFDVNCDLWQKPDGIHGMFTYSTDLFEASTIRRMAGHFHNLLQSALNSPQCRLSELEMLGGAEREQTLVKWNATSCDDGPAMCLHQLFEAQVEQTPNAIAVQFEHLQFSYAELNGRANALAHCLRSLGVGPEIRVGLCMERGLEIIVGLLGILKAGGAYVPLDPNYPLERLRFMLRDSRATALVTQERLRGKLEGFHGPCLCLNQERPLLASELENPRTEVRAHNLAYLIYTSGSTGTPKGVAIQHCSAATLLQWARRVFSSEQLKGMLASTSICFDLSIFEIFAPLVWGHKVIIVENVLRLSSLPPEAGVTLVNTVPSAMTELLRLGPLPASVTTVALAGEPLTHSLTQQIYKQPNVAAVLNLYGPSEDTTYSTWALLEKESTGPVPIGRPIANTQVYLLDEYMQPVAAGVSAQLYIGGAGLARCYLDRPDLTAQSFIPDPYSRLAGARLYRTGDLARYRPDGMIEFQGRKDHQVKVRGFRIELGEIEAVLTQHPEVQEAAVVARQHDGDTRLLAYAVRSPQSNSTNQDLRQYLRSRLPEHMVPGVVVLLEHMPLNANGKLDRKALLAFEAAVSGNHEAFAAARTPAEQLLTEIWSEVLGTSHIGIHDNFFDLGGHSLLATRAISRMRSTFHCDIPLRSLFESPTVAGLAERVESAMGVRAAVGHPILSVPRDTPLPLSFAQQRLWFLDQLQPGSDFYNIPAAATIHGALEIGVLERSLEDIVRRHEALRTCFITQQGEPFQQVMPSTPCPLSGLDFSTLPAVEQQSRLAIFLDQEIHRPFDLGRGPLLRVHLVRLSEQEHVLVLNMHHIVSDAWSLGVFMHELGQLYQAYLKQAPSPLPELPIQYADYAVWQRQWLQGEALERELIYWRKQLANLPGILALPLDHPRPAVQSLRGRKLSLQLPAELREQLKQLCRSQHVTLFMTLLAAFQVLLLRYSGEQDLAVGTPVANRNRIETEGLIGFFVNTLVLRADLTANPRFSELLARVRETALQAYAHQDLPFEKLVEELRPERNPNHTPLFQVMFAMNAFMQEPLSAGALTRVEIETTTVKFDLTMTVDEGAKDGLLLHMDYCTDLFEAATVQRMLGHFHNLLRAIVKSPDCHLSDLEMLGEAECHKILVDWNASVLDYSSSLYVHELFEAQVKRTPNAVAVQFEKHKLSYQELDLRSNQVANWLRAQGTGPEVMVGVCLERSLEMVAAILGVLKAGGAYVPLDPAYPKERLHFMLRDSKTRSVLTEAAMGEKLEGCGAELLYMDTVRATPAGMHAPIAGIESEHPAYVIYTSGSTGEPKGVVVPHGSLKNHMEWMGREFPLGLSDSVLQKTVFSFDASVWEFYAPLLAGACLVMARPGGQLDPEYLIQCIQEEQITVIQLVPTQLQMLLENKGLAQCRSLRRVYCGGEPLTRDHVTRFYALLPETKLYNLYGPTEATIDATFAECRVSENGVTASIGQPIANTQVYLLDEQMQPVPAGVTGQLYIGGAGLARCYLGRPSLTAQAFIPHPYGQVVGARLYRTGDLARWNKDGKLEYLGRCDQQVKIRGSRIECGEIEGVLAKHPEVLEAAVIAQPHNGDKRLIAYAVCSAHSETTHHDLRQYLRDRLPEYMVPSAVVLLDHMPLAPNGKVDRRAFPDPEQGANNSQSIFVAPRDVIELQVVRIWEELLNVRPIGVHDNFFDLGGHSLLAVRLMACIRASFQQDLPLMALFQAPDVEQLAQRLRQREPQGKRSPLVPIQIGGRGHPIFMVHPVGGQVLCYYELARHLGPEQSVYGLEAAFLDQTNGSSASIEQMADEYIGAIQTVEPAGPYFLGGWSIGGIVAFEMARRLTASGDDVRLLAILDSPAPQNNNVDAHVATSRSLVSIASVFEIYTGKRLNVCEEDMRLLSREQQLNLVVNEMKNKGLAPPDVGVSYLRGFLHVAENNLRAKWNYVPTPYSGRITIFRAQELLSGFEEDQDPEIYGDPAFGWQRLSTEPIAVHSVPGNHVSMLAPPNVQALAGPLKHYLDEVQGD